MVEAREEPNEVQVQRNTPYGVWREDKPAEEGYSRELVHHRTPKECWDDFDRLDCLKNAPCDTVISAFLNQV